MALAEYGELDGLGLADLVRRGEVTPRELVDEALRRVDAVQPALNCVVHRMDDHARAATAGPPGDGPFAGVPFLVKDLLSTYAGTPSTSGSRAYRGWIAPKTSELAGRFARAGLIACGKTAAPELGLLPVTEPRLFGPCRNPWDPTRTPGGSSGGSAAAVAARVVPLASGGDGGGSIRIPASCCGLFGLKPTRGRTPNGPDDVEYWQGCAIEHVLTRSVRDSAAVLDAVGGPDPGARWVVPAPARPFLDEVTTSPGRLRIAWTTTPPVPCAGVDPACVAAVEDAVRLLEGLGHEVVEARPALDGPRFALDYVTMLVGETAADVREAVVRTGRRGARDDFEPTTRLLALLGEALPAAAVVEATRRLKRQGRVYARFFDEGPWDALVTPVLARPPVEVGTVGPRGVERALIEVFTRLRAGGALRALGVLERAAATAWDFAPFTAAVNVAGNPAMSVPLVWSAEGLPIGVHVVGRWGDEATLFRLAGQLEQARPWAGRRPRVVADAAPVAG